MFQKREREKPQPWSSMRNWCEPPWKWTGGAHIELALGWCFECNHMVYRIPDWLGLSSQHKGDAKKIMPKQLPMGQQTDGGHLAQCLTVCLTLIYGSRFSRNPSQSWSISWLLCRRGWLVLLQSSYSPLKQWKVSLADSYSYIKKILSTEARKGRQKLLSELSIYTVL